jgi:hypothetical protein
MEAPWIPGNPTCQSNRSYLYLIIKYVRFPLSTTFLDQFALPPNHILHYIIKRARVLRASELQYRVRVEVLRPSRTDNKSGRLIHTCRVRWNLNSLACQDSFVAESDDQNNID